MWVAAIVTALIFWPVSSDPIAHDVPVTWLWQAILVGIGVALAAGPLWSSLQRHPGATGGETGGEKLDAAAVDPRDPAHEPVDAQLRS